MERVSSEHLSLLSPPLKQPETYKVQRAVSILYCCCVTKSSTDLRTVCDWSKVDNVIKLNSPVRAEKERTALTQDESSVDG